MPRSFLVKTKHQQQQRHDVTSNDVRDDYDDDVTASQHLPLPKLYTGLIRDAAVSVSDQNVAVEPRVNHHRPPTTDTGACHVTLPPAGTHSHLNTIMTSSSLPSPLFAAASLAWLRQLHAMCAAADTQPFPLLSSPETSAYYVTKMATTAPMQPFDPRWASCPPSPSTAPPCVQPVQDPPQSRVGGRRGGNRDFSIPSILSRAGSTGADSDSTTEESDERCRSTTSSPLDDLCGGGGGGGGSELQRHWMTSQRHVMTPKVTSYDSGNVEGARVDLLSHQRRRRQLHDKQQFQCPHCDKVYSTMGALKMHVRTHTLPCRCPLCGKAFSRPWLLQGHLRTHTGERPFQCPHCERAFADRSNLRAHLQTHAGVKRYRCLVCCKPFSRMSLLAKHHEAASCHND